ncbi:MAG: endo alpha-1,4 polygalactosaminidase [Rhodospirillales bacterium]|nr:endo alpha-1,4 polygalactosaminidase [Rhodospirillales bacterium]
MENRRVFARGLIAILGALPMLTFLQGLLRANEDPFRWAVYYGADAPDDAFAGYRLVVFDSDRHPDIEPVVARRGQALGYLSIGEVHRTRSYFTEVEREGLLVYENPNWPGAFAVDVRDPRWRRRVVDELVPSILARGFQGVFLDTADTAIDLERRDRTKFAGSTLATIELVKAIRNRNPGMPIILNRGYEILPAVETAIDMVLAESLVTDWDFQGKAPRMAPPGLHASQVELLSAARKRRPALRVLALEYWTPEDTATIRSIYGKVRALGFAPYVATVALDRVVPEPQ